MGRLDETAPGHEGSMERELVREPLGEDAHLGHHDSLTGSWWCTSWVDGLPDPTGRWRAVCVCGWRGDIADTATIAGIDPDHDPVDDMLDQTGASDLSGVGS